MFSYRDRSATLVLSEGFVTGEFINLARSEERTAEQEQRLGALKLELAERVLARPGGEVFDEG